MAISALTMLLELVVRPTEGGRLFMRKANELESSGAPTFDVNWSLEERL